MKKYLPRILFVVVLLASVLYLVPNFTAKYQNHNYSFTNFQSLFNAEKNTSGLRLQGVSDTFVYEIESVTPIDKQSDWNYIVPKDQLQLERRVESFLGNNFEVRVDKKDNKPVFSVYTQRNMGDSVRVLTTNNADFAISELVTATATAEDGTQATPTSTKLDLKRSEFGSAIINATQQQDNSIVYEVKLPTGILTPEKINLIKTKAYSQLTAFIGGKEYSASFLPNVTGVITHLVINQISTVDEAAAVRTYLNTDSYFLGYKLNSVKTVAKDQNAIKVAALIAFTLIVAVLLNQLTSATLTGKKALRIASYLVIGVAAFKLFGLSLTAGVILVLMLVTLLAIFNARAYLFVGFIALLLITQLFGYLYYLGLNWSQVIILLATSALIWSTNYVKKSKN